MKSARTGRRINVFRAVTSFSMALALVLMFAHSVGAASIQHDVHNLASACQLGGGSASVTLHYKGNTLTSADVDCSGGAVDGYGCTFDGKTTVCSGARILPPQRPLNGARGGVSKVGAATAP